MNIYNKNKKHWSQVQMMGCLHMRMLKNVCSLYVIAVSITLSLFGSFVWCFYLAMLFFHTVLPSRNLCFYAGDTHFYSHLKSNVPPLDIEV